MDFLDIHHTTVQHFSAMSRFEEWYNITAIRVLNIWSDYEHNRVLLWLLDSNRDTKIAVCPKSLEPILIQMNLRENVFALNHFQLYECYLDHPTYHYYKISTSDRGIIFNHNTNLTWLADDFANTFPRYSLVSNVTTLADNHTKRKMLINVVGRVVWGKRRRLHAFVLFLQDETGNIIKFKLNNLPLYLMEKVYLAINNKHTMYVSRVKLVHEKFYNVLVSTALTDFAMDPYMPEAERIKERYT
ncbi:hypothetical protein LXL04_000340 [Taraxacum kok-saghyz]